MDPFSIHERFLSELEREGAARDALQTEHRRTRLNLELEMARLLQPCSSQLSAIERAEKEIGAEVYPVDSGIGGNTKQFNDVVVAFPPTTAGSGTVVSPPPAPSVPKISGTCITGCTTTSSTIAFAINTGGSFLLTVTGYPPPTISESGTLPSGLTFNSLTGILGGTPTSGVNGSFPISFTASNGWDLSHSISQSRLVSWLSRPRRSTSATPSLISLSRVR